MVAGMGGLLYFSYLPGIYEDRHWPRPGWLQVFFVTCLVFVVALVFSVYFSFGLYFLRYSPGWLQGALGFGFCICYSFGFFFNFFLFTHSGLVAGPWGPVSVPGS